MSGEGDKGKANVRALKAFRLKGRTVVVGEVVPKTDFGHKSDWQNLLNMEPPRLEETKDNVGVPKKKPSSDGIPGASS